MTGKRVGLSYMSGLVMLVLALLFQLGLPPSSLAAKVKLGTALGRQAVFAMPMLAIEENKLWKQVGVDAEWVPFRGGAAMNRAAAAGAIQLGITDVTGAVMVMGRGAPVIIVYHMAPVTDFNIWVLADSKIKGPKDLKGKTISVTRLGGTGHGYGQLVAKAEGLEKDIRFVGTGGVREDVAALLSGAVDSVMLTPFVTAPLVAKGRVRKLVSMHDYLPKEWMGRVVYTTNQFLKQDPDSVGKVVRSVNMATKFVMENRAWTIKKMISFSKYTPEAAELLFPRLKYSRDGRIDKQAVANVRDFLIKYKLINRAKTPPAEKLFTGQFIR